ncbi:MAG: hypothetical protein LBS21_14920 [Clostridiales bacterium]|jgi:hypothetical protein|nr:hypothetical protein [Clostridiales bacterium]
MSKIKNKILLIVALLMLISAGVLFVLSYNPGSLKYVKRKLDSYLKTEYVHVSTQKTVEPTIEGIKPVTYFFKDINGVEFSVVAFPPFGDYDSSQPGYPRCDYLSAYCLFNKELIEKAIQCEVPVTCGESRGFFSVSYKISDYNELELIAPSIEKALNMFSPLISENFSAVTEDKFEFLIPEIAVETVDGKEIISFFKFRLTDGENSLTKNEILEKLEKDFKVKL